MRNPHILVIPFPAQGHVNPLMGISRCLVQQGLKVTFVNTEYNHKPVVNTLEDKNNLGGPINLVSIPDGMAPEERNDPLKLSEAICRVMPRKLEELIQDINASEGDRITRVIADYGMGWALEVAQKMEIPSAAFWPASVAILALLFYVPKLIESGIINSDGTPIKEQTIHLAPNMPVMSTTKLFWTCMGDLTTQKTIFHSFVRYKQHLKIADQLICNSAFDLEPAAFNLVPEAIPIGPLVASNEVQDSAGNFWQEDMTCLEWLDQQPLRSVIYVAFGSLIVFDETQFHELALGLELSNRPFLWVVRPDITQRPRDAYPTGFLERVASRGRIVGWAPQQKVLSHPSVACFLSRCGWNSTVEGVTNGVPFLCWPYFVDQLCNESYICDVWKVGLRFNRDERGIITQGEIKGKVEKLLSDENFKSRALDLQQMVSSNIKEGGCSNKNLQNFVQWLKA